MKTFEHSQLIKQLPQQFFATLVKKVQHASSQGQDVINLGQGNPDTPTPIHIVESLQQAAEKPIYHKYSPFRGYSFLKQAIATFYEREYGVTLDPEKEVAILFGGKAGLVEVSQCLLNEGDLALVPDPGYPDYWSGIALAKAEMEVMPLLEKNDFLPNYNQIDDTSLERAKLLFLNYPNNPTGAIATDTLFKDTVTLAEKHNICIVHDFAYGAISFDGTKPISFLQTPGAKDVGIEIYTLSKTFNMAGWRVAFAVGNPSVIEALNLLQDHINVSLFGGIQEAAATALLESQDSVRTLVEKYEARRNVLIDGLRQIGWDVKAPAGSFFCWLPVPKGFQSQTFFDYLLENAGIAVAPGVGFGNYGEGYVRVGLLSDERTLLEAVNRIEKLHLF